eukprot:3679609-Prymnesium_polylepis.1
MNDPAGGTPTRGTATKPTFHAPPRPGVRSLALRSPPQQESACAPTRGSPTLTAHRAAIPCAAHTKATDARGQPRAVAQSGRPTRRQALGQLGAPQQALQHGPGRQHTRAVQASGRSSRR